MGTDSNCPLCTKVVKNSDQSICCDAYDLWHHIKCVKIPPEVPVYNFLKKGSDGLKHGIFKWYCSKCQPVVNLFEKQSIHIK